MRRLIPARLTGYLLAAIGASLFASKGIAIKLAYQHGVSAETLLTLRLALSAPIYMAIGLAALAGGRTLPASKTLLKIGAVGALGYWFASYTDFLGLKYITVQFERLILFTYPAFVVLFGALLFRQRVRPVALLGVAVSYAGLALMFGTKLSVFGSGVVTGSLLVLSASIAFAFYQLLAKDLVVEVGARLFTCIAMLGATAATFAQYAATQPLSDLMVSPPVFGYALFLAIGATVVPTFFLNAALERISAQANGAIGTLSPVVTILLAVAILHEQVTLLDWAATALVLAGVAWFTFADSRRRRPRPAAPA